MPIQAGNLDVGSIWRTDTGVFVTLRDPLSNQPAYPKTQRDHANRQLAESQAQRFLDDCQAALEQCRDEWGELLRQIDDPRAAGLWRDDYEGVGRTIAWSRRSAEPTYSS